MIMYLVNSIHIILCLILFVVPVVSMKPHKVTPYIVFHLAMIKSMWQKNSNKNKPRIFALSYQQICPIILAIIWIVPITESMVFCPIRPIFFSISIKIDIYSSAPYSSGWPVDHLHQIFTFIIYLKHHHNHLIFGIIFNVFNISLIHLMNIPTLLDPVQVTLDPHHNHQFGECLDVWGWTLSKCRLETLWSPTQVLVRSSTKGDVLVVITFSSFGENRMSSAKKWKWCSHPCKVKRQGFVIQVFPFFQFFLGQTQKGNGR